MGVTSIDIPAPGSSIPTAYNDTLAFTVMNFGDPMPANDSLIIGIYVDGALQLNGFIYELPTLWPTSVAIQLLIIYDIGALSLTAGPHTICLTTLDINDVDLTNDSSCASYTITVPPPPAGIGSALGSQSSIFLVNGQLNLDVSSSDISGSTAVTVYNMSGTLIHSENISGSGNLSAVIDLDDHAAGVYVVRLVSSGKLVEVKKLMK